MENIPTFALVLLLFAVNGFILSVSYHIVESTFAKKLIGKALVANFLGILLVLQIQLTYHILTRLF